MGHNSNDTNVGVIVGRFQVPDLHEGHIWLIEHALAAHRQVVVFVGVPPRQFSKNNPLNYATRERMIRAAFPDVTVMPLLDRATNEEWSEKLDESIEIVTMKTGTATIYGGRNSGAIKGYKGKFKPCEVDSGMEGKSGSQIRKDIGKVVRSTSDFRAGQIYYAQNAPVRPVVGVDIALVVRRETGLEIALGRKDWDAPGLWRLPGGKIEPEDVSFEASASRELEEETGIVVAATHMKYLSSAIISDWRDHGHRDLTYFSSLFVTEVYDGCPPFKANDDLIEVKWFPLATADKIGVPKHAEMIALVQSHFKWEQFKRNTK